MLVLSRVKGGTITVDDDGFRITVAEFHGTEAVTLSIAPTVNRSDAVQQFDAQGSPVIPEQKLALGTAITPRLKKNESVTIGVCKCTIVEIRPSDGIPKVRLGIEAPREMTVHRLEAWEQIHPKQT